MKNTRIRFTLAWSIATLVLSYVLGGWLLGDTIPHNIDVILTLTVSFLWGAVVVMVYVYSERKKTQIYKDMVMFLFFPIMFSVGIFLNIHENTWIYDTRWELFLWDSAAMMIGYVCVVIAFACIGVVGLIENKINQISILRRLSSFLRSMFSY